MNRPPSILSPTVAMAGMPSTRDFSGTWRQFMGIPEGPSIDAYRTMSDFAKAPADEAWVYRCVNLKAAFAQGVPLRVYVKSGKELTPVEDTTDGAAQDLQGLLDDVNPISMNGSDLKAFTIGALSVWGENYWRKVRGRLGGEPKELWWLAADEVTPKVGRVWIDSYDYTGRDRVTENYPARDIVAFRRLNLQDPTRGLSPLSAARYEISTNRQAAEWNASTLANWGIPAVYWQIPKDADFTPQDRSLVQRALRALRGPRNQGKAPIVPQGLEAKQLALSPKDAEWLASRKVSRMTICAVEGVPLVLAGDDDKASVYANLRDAERIFARSMISELDWVADGINGWLVPDFDPSPPGRRRIVVGFDYSGIEALQPALREDYLAWQSWIDRGVAVPNEARRHFRLGPDLPWGDQPLLATSVIPTDSVEADQLKQEAAMDGNLPPEQPAATGGIRHLYRHAAVRAWFADPSPSALADVADLLGVEASDDLADGLRRRYTTRQLLDGFPSEGFAGLRIRSVA